LAAGKCDDLTLVPISSRHVYIPWQMSALAVSKVFWKCPLLFLVLTYLALSLLYVWQYMYMYIFI